MTEAPATAAGLWHGALAREETGAMRCASAELERRREANRQPELEAAR